jgi:NADH:ubiquinone oxidoreductase subunit D
MSIKTTHTYESSSSNAVTSVVYEQATSKFDLPTVSVISSVTASKGQYRVFVSTEGAKAGNLSTTSTQEAYRAINSVLTRKLSGR